MQESTKKEMEDLVTALKTINNIPWGRLDELIIDWEVIDDGGYVRKVLPKVKIKIKDSTYLW